MSSNVQRLETKTRNVAVAEDRAGARNDETIEFRRVECLLTEPLFKRLLRRIFPDRRKQERMPVPPLVGYLGTASSSKAYDLADISLTGFCLLTDERWIPGTEMPITLQKTNLPSEKDPDCFTVQATVVRCGQDSVGFSIVLCEEESLAAHGNPLRVKWITRRADGTVPAQCQGAAPFRGGGRADSGAAVCGCSCQGCGAVQGCL